MKSYTDIEQSRDLAKILPLESADYFHAPDAGIVITEPYQLNNSHETVITAYKGAVPCWSLAALYGLLPNNEKESTNLSRGGWKIKPPEYIDNWWCEYEDDSHIKDFTVSADNPVDACVDMIIKLNELKML